MPKVRYSNKAVEDLSSIWDYTFTYGQKIRLTGTSITMIVLP